MQSGERDGWGQNGTPGEKNDKKEDGIDMS
jgi:hypothetical protein